MNNSSRPSASTKLHQAYWEAKRNLKISLGNKDDECMVASDAELDTKIEFLHAAYTSFNCLLSVLSQYKKAISSIAEFEENFASTLIEFGVRDQTKAGEFMAISGKALSRSASKRIQLRHEVSKLYHEVHTFQYKATADAFVAVAKIEKVRRSYRSGLMWMKNESQSLDPDHLRQVKRFKRIQEHIRNLKIRFDGLKLEVMQKIDLYMLSRCNLFSQTMLEYQNSFCKMSRYFVSKCEEASKKTRLCNSFQFNTLKELNEYKDCLARFPSVDTKSNPLDPLSGVTSETDTEKLENRPREGKVRNHLSGDKSQDREFLLQLVNLDDSDFDRNGFPRFDFSSELPQRSTISSNKKYSDDLLSLNLNECSKSQAGLECGDVETDDSSWEKCVKLLDSIKPCLLDVTHSDKGELEFWNLMEGYKGDSYSPASSNSKADSKDTTTCKKSSSNSNLVDVLIEFDPFLNGNELFLDKNNNETC